MLFETSECETLEFENSEFKKLELENLEFETSEIETSELYYIYYIFTDYLQVVKTSAQLTYATGSVKTIKRAQVPLSTGTIGCFRKVSFNQTY